MNIPDATPADLPRRHRSAPVRWLALAALCVAATAAPAADAPAPYTPTQNVTINLINLMVQRGLLPREDADRLIRQAEDDATAARAEAAATQAALAKLAAAPPSAPAAAPAPAADADVVRVTYIPEYVKRQLKEELRQEVFAEAVEERWAAPRALPEWATRYTFFGDLRLRYEGLFYPAGNDNTGAFPSFNAINTGSPFDVTGTVFSPQNNVDRARDRMRLRARFGADIDMGDGFVAGARLATGESNSPVTTNQTLGGSGGNFSKYAVWLDRAFLAWTPGGLWSATVGRFENPFFSTTMIFDDDLGFDGVAVQAKTTLGERLKPFATLGAFPVFNSALNFSSIQPAKFQSRDKWLLAGQLGTAIAFSDDLSAKFGAAYYYFSRVEGRRSRPFTPVSAQDNGDTDETRPGFAQNGNTYFPLRAIVPGVLNNYGTTNQWQYFGLATPFHELALTGRLDYDGYEPVRLSLVGEFVANLAFDRAALRTKAVNNLGPKGVGDFAGGRLGWNLDFRVGHAALLQRWDWSASLGYRYLESDAVVDGFTDSDFGNGGTNLQGFTLAGAVALSPRVSVGLRWFSAASIAGPTYKNDLLQFDFNGKF